MFCPDIHNEFRHNIVKVVYGSTWLSPCVSTATFIDNVMMQYVISYDARKTDVNLLTVQLYMYLINRSAMQSN